MNSEAQRSPSPSKLLSPRASPPRHVHTPGDQYPEMPGTALELQPENNAKTPITEPQRPHEIKLLSSVHSRDRQHEERHKSLQATEKKTVPDVVPEQEAEGRRSRRAHLEGQRSRPPPAASSGARRLKAIPRSQSVEASRARQRTTSASGATESQRSRPLSQIRGHRSAELRELVSPTSEATRGITPSVGGGSRLTSTSRTLRGSRSTLFSTGGRSVLSEISPFRITKNVAAKLSLARQTSGNDGAQAGGDSLYLPSYKSFTLPARHDLKSYAQMREARETREKSTERGPSTPAHAQTLFQQYSGRRWPDFAVHPEWPSEAVTRSRLAASEARGDTNWFWSLRIGSERRPESSRSANPSANTTTITTSGTNSRSASSTRGTNAAIGTSGTFADTAQRLGLRTISAPSGDSRV